MDSILFSLWVTSACNLRCKYCYEGVEKPTEFMSEEVAEDTVKFMVRTLKKYDAGSCHIVFHGGEPTLNMPIVKYIINAFTNNYSEIEVTYGMTTNAYKLSKDTIDYLVRNIDDLTVSLDGTEEIHNRNRIDANGTGSFKLAFENALAIKDARDFPLRVRMTVNTSNLDKLYESVVFLIESGFKVIVPGIDYEDKNWSDELLDEFERQYFMIKSYVEGLDDSDVYVSSLSSEEVTKKSVCDGCVSSYHVSPTGLLYPCIYTVGNSEYIYGNVNDGVNNTVFMKYDFINNQDIEECMGCNFYDYCTTKRCKFINKKLTGEFNCPSPVVCASENIKLRLCGII